MSSNTVRNSTNDHYDDIDVEEDYNDYNMLSSCFFDSKRTYSRTKPIVSKLVSNAIKFPISIQAIDIDVSASSKDDDIEESDHSDRNDSVLDITQMSLPKITGSNSSELTKSLTNASNKKLARSRSNSLMVGSSIETFDRNAIRQLNEGQSTLLTGPGRSISRRKSIGTCANDSEEPQQKSQTMIRFDYQNKPEPCQPSASTFTGDTDLCKETLQTSTPKINPGMKGSL